MTRASSRVVGCVLVALVVAIFSSIIPTTCATSLSGSASDSVLKPHVGIPPLRVPAEAPELETPTPSQLFVGSGFPGEVARIIFTADSLASSMEAVDPATITKPAEKANLTQFVLTNFNDGQLVLSSGKLRLITFGIAGLPKPSGAVPAVKKAEDEKWRFRSVSESAGAGGAAAQQHEADFASTDGAAAHQTTGEQQGDNEQAAVGFGANLVRIPRSDVDAGVLDDSEEEGELRALASQQTHLNAALAASEAVNFLAQHNSQHHNDEEQEEATRARVLAPELGVHHATVWDPSANERASVEEEHDAEEALLASRPPHAANTEEAMAVLMLETEATTEGRMAAAARRRGFFDSIFGSKPKEDPEAKKREELQAKQAERERLEKIAKAKRLEALEQARMGSFVRLRNATAKELVSHRTTVLSGGVPQWSLVHLDTFEKSAAGWSDTTRQTLAGAITDKSLDVFLGGYCKFGDTQVSKRFEGLPSHSAVRVQARVHFFDKWDGEVLFLKVGQRAVWSEPHFHCGSLVFSSRCRGINVAGDSAFPDRLSRHIDVIVPHIGDTLRLTFGSTLAKNPCVASWGIDDVSISVL
jgi:hypothetical protein